MRAKSFCWVAGLVLCAGLGCGQAMGQAVGWQAAGSAAAPVMAEAKVYRVEEMAVRKMANGGESRNVLGGVLTTGEAVAAHESMLPAGAEPTPQHVIQHTEIVTVIEGTVTFDHGERSEKVGAGGVIYIAFGTMHRIRNAGDGVARYMVLQIGGDTRK